MDNPYEASQSSHEMPRESLEELREKLRSSGVKTKDFNTLALWAMVPGGFLFVIGLLLAYFAVSSDQIWGVLIPLPGLAMFVVGWGLLKFKPWAWQAAVLVILPSTLLAAAGVLALNIYLRSGGLVAVLILLPLWVGYVFRVLLSPVGRLRYRLMVDVTARETEIKERVQAHGRAVAAESLDEFFRQ